MPGGFCVCPGETGLHSGLCRLCAGIVSYGASKGEWRAEMAREDGCTLKNVSWHLRHPESISQQTGCLNESDRL